MGDEGVDQGAVRVAGRGVDHQAGGLVEHEEVLVLKEDGKRHGFALRCGGGWGGGGEPVGGAGAHGFGGVGGDGAVTREQAFQEHPLDAGAGDGADGFCQEDIQPQAGIFRRGEDGYFRERVCRINHRRICGG